MIKATELLLNSLVQVLEQASFLYPTSPLLKDFDPYNPGQSYESLDELLLATVDSDSALICLWVPNGLGAIMAANMLGIEPDDTHAEDRIMDAVGEMTNMVAGLVVNSGAESPEIEMTVPSVWKPDYFEILASREGFTLMGTVSFFVEEEHRISGAVFRKNAGVGLQ